MAVIAFHFFKSNFLLCNSSSSSSSSSYSLNSFKLHSNGGSRERTLGGGRTGKRRSTRSFVVLSMHSNPRILKSNRKSRHGQRLSPYDTYEDAEDEDLDDDYDDDNDDVLSEEEVSEMEDLDSDLQSFNSGKATNAKQGCGLPKNQYREGLSRNGQFDIRHRNITLEKRKFEDARRASDKVQEKGFVAGDSRRKFMQQTSDSKQSRFHQLSEELDLDAKWFPLLDYLSTFGLGESHFTQMFERHMPSLQINVTSAQERLEFLLSVGVKHRDIKRILLRQPQILEYTVENNMKSHVAFLANLGIPDSRIGQIITAAPSLFSYSVEQSLKPTVRYLVEEVGIKSTDLSKVVQLSPQILVQRIDVSWKSRYFFLSKELGAPRDKIVKMVTKHPQLLHYSIEDGILPRINFLRSIGMQNSDILKVLTSLTQVLSLSLEDNLKPKYSYLVNELRNEVQSLTKYPMYLSLSLDQRIRPRHRFLVSLKKAPKGPFPLGSLVPTDERFCLNWAGTSLEKYLAFKQSLLLKEFAKKYERKR